MYLAAGQGPAGPECNVLNNCHQSASCELTHTGSYACRCGRGFIGDGYSCRPEMEGRPESRPACSSQEDCHENGHCVVLDGYNDFACECLPGFIGDGRNYCDSADECSPGQDQSLCSPYATCEYLEARRAYVCLCGPGFEGNGKDCRQAMAGPPSAHPHPSSHPQRPTDVHPHPPQELCDRNPNLCHRDAQCILDYDTNRHRCQCLDGFAGDGERSCERAEEDCSTKNDCHADADCLRDYSNNRHFCKCKFGYAGDGKSCQPTTTCQAKPDLCHAMADCVPEAYSYICRCKQGYHGNGRQCTEDSNLRGRSLLFGQGMSVVKRGFI